VALVFYPSPSLTGVCDGELCAIRDDYAEFESAGVRAGLFSLRHPFAYSPWAKQQGYNFPGCRLSGHHARWPRPTACSRPRWVRHARTFLSSMTQRSSYASRLPDLGTAVNRALPTTPCHRRAVSRPKIRRSGELVEPSGGAAAPRALAASWVSFSDVLAGMVRACASPCEDPAEPETPTGVHHRLEPLVAGSARTRPSCRVGLHRGLLTGMPAPRCRPVLAVCSAIGRRMKSRRGCPASIIEAAAAASMDSSPSPVKSHWHGRTLPRTFSCSSTSCRRPRRPHRPMDPLDGGRGRTRPRWGRSAHLDGAGLGGIASAVSQPLYAC